MTFAITIIASAELTFVQLVLHCFKVPGPVGCISSGLDSKELAGWVFGRRGQVNRELGSKELVKMGFGSK